MVASLVVEVEVVVMQQLLLLYYHYHHRHQIYIDQWIHQIGISFVQRQD